MKSLLLFLVLCFLVGCQSLRNARLVKLNNAAMRPFLLLITLALCSCMHAQGEGWQVTAVLTDAKKINCSKERGLEVVGLNHSRPIKTAGEAVGGGIVKAGMVGIGSDIVHEGFDAIPSN